MSSKTAILGFVCALPLMISSAVSGEEKISVLKIGDDVFRDVTVTEVTALDIYFKHAKGFGSAKLKKLSPELQQRFGFDSAKAEELEKQRAVANAEYRQNVATNQPPAPKVANDGASAEPDVVLRVPQVHARRILHQTAPELVAEKWITEPPDTDGKFILLEFWATWCGPCRQSIPHLNALQAKHKDRLVVIGLSDEPESAIRRMTSPKIEYPVAIDTHARLLTTLAVRGIPHAILVDPQGVVRYEGSPFFLTEDGLELLLKRYDR